MRNTRRGPGNESHLRCSSLANEINGYLVHVVVPNANARGHQSSIPPDAAVLRAEALKTGLGLSHVVLSKTHLAHLLMVTLHCQLSSETLTPGLTPLDSNGGCFPKNSFTIHGPGKIIAVFVR